MMSTTETKGTALITGASAGIGAIYADRLSLSETIRTKESMTENTSVQHHA
jgi:short-subunit dehydrogenase